MIDFSEFHQIINEQLPAAKPFVAYRKPGNHSRSVQVLLQEDTTSYRIQNFEESGFIFAAFNSAESVYFIPSSQSRSFRFNYDSGYLENEENDIGMNEAEGNFEQMESDQKSHENLVQKGIDQIKRGDLKKVVLSRSEKVEILDPDPIAIFKKLLHKYPNAFVYVWFHPETGCWLGATPEKLLQTERMHFKTMALAGTQVYKGSTDVEWQQKEVEEQLFVTDYILESLEKVAGISNIEVSKPYSVKAGNLLHIQTDITGKLNDTSKGLKNIINALHPTPAVCGLPSEKALSFILENENYSREFYTGYLGELNIKTETCRNANRRNQENQQFKAISQKTDLYVNLRCMKLNAGDAKIFVGGGVTKNSNAGDEWMETVNKSQTMKSVLVK